MFRQLFINMPPRNTTKEGRKLTGLELEVGRRLAKRLDLLMGEHGFTQTALAKKAGVTQPQISRIIHTKRLPELITLIKLASALGVRVGWLACGEDPQRPGVSVFVDPDAVVDDSVVARISELRRSQS